MKILIAFDSFKGSLTADEACLAAERGMREAGFKGEVVRIPLSDGGEGLVDCFLRTVGMLPVSVKVHGPLMEEVHATYAVSEDGEVAYMEMASACGLTLVPVERRDPLKATTYGLGEMMQDAVRRGVKHIVLGIGGSATCDAGRGMLEALGLQPKQGESLSAPLNRCGAHRNDDVGHNAMTVWGTPILTVACDVDNPLFGENGAACVFAPQKGATPEQVALLDARLRAFARETEERGLAAPEDAFFPGAGAAGGLGYTLRTYLKADLKRGVDVVMDAMAFDQAIEGADFVLTGEGCSDEQTLHGKVAAGVMKRAREKGVKVLLMSGKIKGVESLKAFGFEKIYDINAGDERPLSVLMQPEVAKENIRRTCERMMEELR